MHMLRMDHVLTTEKADDTYTVGTSMLVPSGDDRSTSSRGWEQLGAVLLHTPSTIPQVFRVPVTSGTVIIFLHS